MVLYKLCIIKIYLCTKDFFVCFCFTFFFPSWDGDGCVMWMVGEGSSLPRSLPSLWRQRESARGGKGSAQQGAGCLTSLGSGGAPPGTSQGDTGGGRGGAGGGARWVSERSVRRGREQPESFLHLFPGKETSVGVCPLPPSPGMLCGQHWPCCGQSQRHLLEIHFPLQPIFTSQIFSLFQPRICLRTKHVCMFLFVISKCDTDF